MRRAAAYSLVCLLSLRASAGEVPLPPAPAGPGEIEVSFPGYQGFGLRGTLSLPSRPPKSGAPGVLLLPGSGATDRNGNPPGLTIDSLRQMAERLVREGFVVLRFDKRAAAIYQTGWPVDPVLQNSFFAWEGFTGDARSALELLRGRPEVDPARTAIVGHSEGGLIALQVASDLQAASSPPPAVLVLAGTAATTIGPLLRFQIGQALAWQKADEATSRQYLDALDRAVLSVIETGAAPADLPPGISGLFPANGRRLMRSYLTVDPLALAKAYRGPVLLLHGGADLQVPAEEHTAKLLAALATRQDGLEERVVIPNASHNLKRVSGPQDPAFVGDLVPEALDTLAGFLKRELAKK